MDKMYYICKRFHTFHRQNVLSKFFTDFDCMLKKKQHGTPASNSQCGNLEIHLPLDF